MNSHPDPAAEVERARRDARACELRASGMTYRAIAAELGCSPDGAWQAVQRGLASIRREPAEELVKAELDHLDHLRERAAAVLHATHVATSGTELVRGEDGHVLVDHGPVLAAIRTLVQLAERRAKLLGLDAPSKVDMRTTLAAAWANATFQERDQVLNDDIAELKAEWDRRHGPAAFQAAVKQVAAEHPQEPDPEHLAELVELALAAAGITEDSAEWEQAAAAVEARLRAQGNGGPS